MVVKWSDPSKRALRSIFSYYCDVAGRKRADKLIAEIKRSAMRLENSPRMATVDPLFERSPRKFRSLVVKKIHKIVYYIDERDNCIYIVDVWDCRQDPKKLMGRLSDWG
ncbi:Plasmid stabilization system protein [Bacteroidales bacterium Barb6XT]|nr:Plasmid stabilization system protein [Bacteroidales bacterium Barb6XT]